MNIRPEMMKDSRTCRMGVVSAIAALTPAASLLPRLPQWVEFARLWGPLLAVVLGILTLIRIRVSEGTLHGRGWAWIGTILGAGQLLFWFGLLAFFFSGGDGIAK